nr:hypothetical protein [Citrobacter freundii]
MLRIGQVEPSATADGKYTDGSVAGGIAATRLRAAAFNAMQEELANIVESAGMILSPDDMTQVLTALKKQLLSRANPFADIKADGPAAVAAALSNLQLGKAAKRDVGTGSNQIPDMSSFSTGTTSSGRWAKLPSGLIIQAGFGLTGSNGTAMVNLPIPFTGTYFVVGGSIEGNGPIFVSARGLTQSTIGVVAWGRDGSIQVTNMHWLAIGV